MEKTEGTKAPSGGPFEGSPLFLKTLEIVLVVGTQIAVSPIADDTIDEGS